jgi:hypothetical protein
MTPVPANRLRREIRTIVVSFKSAEGYRDDEAVAEARRRAHKLLDGVAVEIEPERDEELAAVLSDARRTVGRSR